MSTIAEMRRTRFADLQSLNRSRLEREYREARGLPATVGLSHMAKVEMIAAIVEHEYGIDWNGSQT
jgi:hypothetical protein